MLHKTSFTRNLTPLYYVGVCIHLFSLKRIHNFMLLSIYSFFFHFIKLLLQDLIPLQDHFNLKVIIFEPLKLFEYLPHHDSGALFVSD